MGARTDHLDEYHPVLAIFRQHMNFGADQGVGEDLSRPASAQDKATLGGKEDGAAGAESSPSYQPHLCVPSPDHEQCGNGGGNNQIAAAGDAGDRSRDHGVVMQDGPAPGQSAEAVVSVSPTPAVSASRGQGGLGKVERIEELSGLVTAIDTCLSEGQESKSTTRVKTVTVKPKNSWHYFDAKSEARLVVDELLERRRRYLGKQPARISIDLMNQT
jgi:hypothetical protein